MVAIVGGNSLGLNLSSLALLGAGGQFGTATQGRSGEAAYVNAANGNLVLQDLDTVLMGVGGSSVSGLRTYNSQGTTGFNSDGWGLGQYKTVTSSGTGLQRVDGDGSVSQYAWDATQQLYVQTLSSGAALNTIKDNGDGTYTWTNGSSGAREIYQTSGAGHILTAYDADGVATSFGYNSSNLLSDVFTADGEHVHYDYTSGNLTGVSTLLADSSTLSQVSYTYDSLNRLKTVSVQLNPEGVVPSGSDSLSTYVTTYSYDGTTNRVANVQQSDGSQLSFTYVLVDGSYKVATSTDGDGNTTQYAYDTSDHVTTVTDPLGVSCKYTYDANGELLQIRTGVTAANTAGLAETNYTYTSLGEVETITDGRGRSVTMEYDARGNLISQTDDAGDKTTWTYNALNQVLTETTYPLPDTPATTRYVYSDDTPTQPSFVISPQGDVVEYRYDTFGMLASTLSYSASQFDVSNMAADAAPTMTDMADWLSSVDLTQVQRTDYGRDFRGQLQTVTTYGSTDETGAGVTDTASTMHYVYDQSGQLRQTISPDTQSIQDFIYDGLGRVVSTTARSADSSLSTTTLTQYDDANGKTTITLANGLATTSAYDSAGRLISITQSSAGTTLGTTRYAYDQDGRLLMTTGPTGQRSWNLYDAAGRQVASIDPSGQLTEFVYDSSNQLTETIAYATLIDTAQLVDSSGNPTTAYNADPAADPSGTTPVTLDSLRPASTDKDSKAWNFYDDAGRLSWQVDALGNVVQTQYDGDSRVIAVTAYATPIDTDSLESGASPADLVAASDEDRSTLYFYDKDGNKIGIVNGEGYLTTFTYNAAGQVIQTTSFDAALEDMLPDWGVKQPGMWTYHAFDPAGIEEAVAEAHAAGTLDALLQLQASNQGQDATTSFIYDGKGLRVGEIRWEVYSYADDETTPIGDTSDPDNYEVHVTETQYGVYIGHLTETVYDENGRVVQQIKYANTVSGPNPETSWVDYDGDGWPDFTSLPPRIAADVTYPVMQGTIGADATLSSLRPDSSADDQISLQTWDALGRLSTQTNAEGTVTTYAYDEVGNLVQSTVAPNTDDQRTLTSRYDVNGNLVAQLSANGAALLTDGQTSAEVDAIWNQYATTYTYDAAGRRTSATDADHHRTVFFYDDDSRLRYTVDAAGDVVESQYDALGHLVATSQYATPLKGADLTSLQGGLLSASSNQASQTALDTAKAASDQNSTIAQAYDANGQITSVTNALGGVTSYGYDAFGEQSLETQQLSDTESVTSTRAYDRRGFDILDVQDVGGLESTIETVYNGRGLVTRVSNNYADTDISYDTLGRVTVSMNVLAPSQTRAVTYDGVDRVLTSQDGNGNVSTYSYDTAGRSVTVTSQDGISITTTHNAEGQTSSITDGNGNVTNYTYDADGNALSKQITQVTTSQDADGNPVTTTTLLPPETYHYDAADLLTSSEDGNGIVTAYTYDAANRLLTQTVDPGGLNLVTQYGYDAKSQQISTTDARGITTLIQYDKAGNVKSHTVDPVSEDNPNGLNLTTYYDYDLASRILSVTTPSGLVTQYTYDHLGRRTQLTVDPDGLALTTYFTYDLYDNVISIFKPDGHTTTNVYSGKELMSTNDDSGDQTVYSYDGAGNLTQVARRTNRMIPYYGSILLDADPSANDQVTNYTYNGDNQLIETSDGLGNLTDYTYDGNGNLTSKRDANNDYTLYYYDAANRLTWSIDGAGDAVQRIYDGSGNLVQQVAYANQVIVENNDGVFADPSWVQPSDNDRVTNYAYDAANRLVYTVNALGGVTQNVYDADGNVVQQIAYANLIAAPAEGTDSPSLDDIASAITTNAADRSTRQYFDAANRQSYSVNALGAVVQYHYDDNGNVIGTTAFSNAVSISALPAEAAHTDLASYLTPDATHDRTTLAAYDGAGRQVYSVDALGYVTQTVFDGVGRIKSSTAYANPASGLSIGSTAADIEQALAGIADPDHDRTKLFNYDAAGNLTDTTDALGNTEHYNYDGAGNRISYTNANGATWTYEYDANGRMTAQHTPGFDANDGSPISTLYNYDGVGNLISETQDSESYEARTLYYEYDALGRQIATRTSYVSVYDATQDSDLSEAGGYGGYGQFGTNMSTGWAGDWMNTTAVVYDAFGDAVAGLDAGGGHSLKGYDKLGRVSYDVDALGYTTGYTYNTFGDVIALSRSANVNPVLSMLPYEVAYMQDEDEIRSVSASLFPDSESIGAGAGWDDSTRTVTTQYDKLGRATLVTQPSTWVYDGNGHSYKASAESSTSYDAFGDVVQQASLADPTTNTWATTTNYYDQRGDMVATIDAMGFVTTQSFDSVGNLLSVTQYAQATTQWDAQSYTTPASDHTENGDRTVTYTYDSNNRKTSQTQVGVYYSPDSSDLNALGTAAPGDVTTTYGYDAVGNLVRTTDALGNSTYTYYDAQGFITAVAAPARTSTTDGSTIIPLTEFERDGFGNVLSQTEYINGASWADESGYEVAGTSFWDRQTTYAYDARGHMTMSRVQTEEATVETDMAYDAAGHLTKILQADDSFTAFEYDAVGHQTAIITPASVSEIQGSSIVTVDQAQAGVDVTGMAWNAFGEMTARGTFTDPNFPQYQESFEYDNAGHLWRTNTGDGTPKVMLYNLQGQQTAQIMSAGSMGSTTNMGVDMSSFADAQAVDAQGSNGLRRSENKLDLMGHVLVQTLPFRANSSGVSFQPKVYQTFDRWGNVVSQSDLRNADWLTTFVYNANNQVIQETQPDGNGNITSDSPVTQLYYDALGQQVAIRDADGNLSGKSWDAGGQLATEIHADGGVIKHSYDVFGEQVQLETAEGGITQYVYDHQGQNTSVINVDADVYGPNWNDTTITQIGSQSGTDYGYVLGHVGLKAWMEGTDQDRINYTYDAKGNLIQDNNGSYAYDAQGHKIGSLDGNGNLSTWTYDSFGQLTGETDLGGASYSFTYDNARQLVAQTSTAGENQSHGQSETYSYDAAGQLVQTVRLVDVVATTPQYLVLVPGTHSVYQTTTFAYNAAGQHVLEQMVQDGITYQSQTLGYDKLGRLSLVCDHVQGLDVQTDYDKVGNKIHVHDSYEVTAQGTMVADYAQEPELDANGNPVMHQVQTGTQTVVVTHQVQTGTVQVAVPETTAQTGLSYGQTGVDENGTPIYGWIPVYTTGYQTGTTQVHAGANQADQMTSVSLAIMSSTPVYTTEPVYTEETVMVPVQTGTTQVAIPETTAQTGVTREETGTDEAGNPVYDWVPVYTTGYQTGTSYAQIGTDEDGNPIYYSTGLDESGHPIYLTVAVMSTTPQYTTEPVYTDEPVTEEVQTGTEQVAVPETTQQTGVQYEQTGVDANNNPTYGWVAIYTTGYQTGSMQVKYGNDANGTPIYQLGPDSSDESGQPVYVAVATMSSTPVYLTEPVYTDEPVMVPVQTGTTQVPIPETTAQTGLTRQQTGVDEGGNPTYEWVPVYSTGYQTGTGYAQIGVDESDNPIYYQTDTTYFQIGTDGNGEPIFVSQVDESGEPVYVTVAVMSSTQAYTTVPVYTDEPETVDQPVYDWEPTMVQYKIGTHLVQGAATSYTQDLYFAYDNMNQQIMADGAHNGNATDMSNITATQGHLLTYDKDGNRTSDTTYGRAVVSVYTLVDEDGNPAAPPDVERDEDGNPILDEDGNPIPIPTSGTVTTEHSYQARDGVVTQWYTYDKQDRLSTVSTGAFDSNGAAMDKAYAITIDKRLYDGAGRVVQSGIGDNGLPSDYVSALVGSNFDLSGATTTITHYNSLSGHVLTQNVVNQADSSQSYTASYNLHNYYTTDVEGDPIYHSGLESYDSAGNLVRYTITQSGITTTYQVDLAKYQGYVQEDVNGNSVNHSSGHSTFGSTVNTYDLSGNLIRIHDTDDGTNTSKDRVFINDASGHILQKQQDGYALNELMVDGKDMGSYGMEAGATNSDGTPSFDAIGHFDPGYTAVTSSYPAAATGSYPVQSGDTLQSIAQAAYGDSSLWYLIANANDLNSNQDMRVGQVLNVPTKVGGLHNNSATYAPYNPSKIVGSTTPNLPTPAGSNGDGGCGGLGMIIMVVVAVVVTVLSEGALAPEMAEILGGSETAGAIAAGAIGGAAGSVASQAVGDAIGAHHGFSWNEVGMGALGGAVSAGIGGIQTPSGATIGGIPGLSGTLSPAMSAVRGALVSAVTQEIAVQVGAQKSFSWLQVAASGAGAAAGQAVSDEIGGKFASLGRAGDVLKGTVSSFAAGATTAAIRGGRVSVTQVAADAFGNALGSSLAEVGQSSGQPVIKTMEDTSTPVESIQAPNIDKLDGSVNLQGLDAAQVPSVDDIQRSRVAANGDSWAKIAKQEYGDERYALALAQANGASTPLLAAGQNVMLPDLSGANLQEGGAFIAADSADRAAAQTARAARAASSIVWGSGLSSDVSGTSFIEGTGYSSFEQAQVGMAVQQRAADASAMLASANERGGQIAAVALAGEFGVLASDLPPDVASGYAGPAGDLVRDPIGSVIGLTESAYNNTIGGLASLTIQGGANLAASDMLLMSSSMPGVDTTSMALDLMNQGQVASQSVLARPTSPGQEVGMAIGNMSFALAGTVGAAEGAAGLYNDLRMGGLETLGGGELNASGIGLEPGSSGYARNGTRLVLDQRTVSQIGEVACGPTSCAMILGDNGLPFNIASIAQDAKIGVDGTNVIDLASAMQKNGVTAARWQSGLTIDDIAAATSNGNAAIVQVDLAKSSHFVVVDGVTTRPGLASGNLVAVRDPWNGVQYFSPVEEFSSRMNGYGILTNPKKL